MTSLPEGQTAARVPKKAWNCPKGLYSCFEAEGRRGK
jgi:hypothetical protein